jgi:Family of unknown function (DUF6900)
MSKSPTAVELQIAWEKARACDTLPNGRTGFEIRGVSYTARWTRGRFVDVRCESARSSTLETIGRQHLGLETLAARNSDGLDFSDQAVWSIKAALEAAFEAGREAARNEGK